MFALRPWQQGLLHILGTCCNPGLGSQKGLDQEGEEHRKRVTPVHGYRGHPTQQSTIFCAAGQCGGISEGNSLLSGIGGGLLSLFFSFFQLISLFNLNLFQLN